MLTLVNNDIENLCNGSGNNNGNTYRKLYYGAGGGGAVGGNIDGEDAPGTADV